MERDEILVALIKLQTMQENMLASFNEYKSQNKEANDVVTDRITDIETKINYAAGAVAVSLAVIWAAFDYIREKFTGG